MVICDVFTRWFYDDRHCRLSNHLKSSEHVLFKEGVRRFLIHFNKIIDFVITNLHL